MDYLKKVLGISRLKNLSNEKNIILTKQEQLDSKLDQLTHNCPKEIAHFLLKIRRDSRVLQKNIVNSNISDTIAKIEEEHKESLKMYEELDKIFIESHSVCNKLHTFRD